MMHNLDRNGAAKRVQPTLSWGNIQFRPENQAGGTQRRPPDSEFTNVIGVWHAVGATITKYVPIVQYERHGRETHDPSDRGRSRCT